MSEELDRQLMEAVKNDDFAKVKATVEAGANVNANVAGYYALEEAAGEMSPNAFAIVQYLVEQGADVNVRWVLVNAAKSDNPDALAIVQYLVKHGADVNIKNGWVLFNAAGSNNPDAFAMVKLLIEWGADVNANNTWALKSAAGSANPDAFAIVRYLVKHGAIVDKRHALILRYAVLNRNPDALAIIKYLVERGADVNACDENSYVVELAVHSRNSDIFDIIVILVENGADINIKNGVVLKETIDNDDDDCPNTLAIVKYLVEHGVNVNFRDSSGYTALTTAIYLYKHNIARYLISNDSFLPSQLIPCPKGIEDNIYKTYRKKAIEHVVKSIERKDIAYARTIADDIVKMLKNGAPAVTVEDREMLESIVKKISLKDRVRDAQVSSGDFMDCDVER